MARRLPAAMAICGLLLLSACAAGTSPSQSASASSVASAPPSAAVTPEASPTCAPDPSTGITDLCRPGPLASGTYTTRYFVPGMTVGIPGDGWSSEEDSGGEFKLQSRQFPGASIFFWLDPHPFDVQVGERVDDVRSPEELAAWLGSNPDLVVTANVAGTIADGVAATVLDLEESATGPQEDPACPGPCTTWLHVSGPNFSFTYGTGNPEPVRFYLASIGSGGTAHVFAVSIDTPDAATFAAFAPIAQGIIGSIRFPATLPPARD